ncbi:hypothetical protein [Streptomyces sp. NPDC050121]|uniref:hypothetical protein n=1 Tax=Streptomyces sp. NPDC050121 TaxID=3365601 RepID=UPI0037904B18
MSSPLDGRIRAMAREEAAALLGVASATPSGSGPDRVEELAKEVAELRALVENLATKEPTAQASPEERPAARRTRKASE